MSTELRAELRRLFSLAFPLAAAEAGTQVMSLVDMAVIGRLGGLELAAAGLANAVYFGISVFGLGLMLGVDPLISQAVGARDFSRGRRVMWQGIWLALITAALLTILLLCGPLLLRAIGVKPEIVRPASIFLLIRTIGLSPWLVFFVIRAYLQAHHVTRPMVTSMIISNVLNLIIDIVLVFGFGPIPALGVAGAAISTVSCQFLQMAIVAFAVVRIPAGGPIARRWNSIDIRRTLRVGLPTALQVTAEVGIFALVALLAGRMGTVELAAHQLVISLASFTFTTALGVATAGSVRVGLAVGARDRHAARLAGYAAYIGAAIVMSAGALAFIIFPDGPLLFFLVSFLIGYRRFLAKEDLPAVLLMGFSTALMLYSKYHGILVVGFTVLSNLKLLRSPKFWLSMLLALVLFLPHLAWLYTHQFPTFQYQLEDRAGPITTGHLYEYISQQLLAMVSRADIPLPDPVAYRRDWRNWRIRLGFGTPPEELQTFEIPAPEPPPG